ncbi:MAG: hypothetical protein U0670_01235 [Anaerolineae bacterium]
MTYRVRLLLSVLAMAVLSVGIVSVNAQTTSESLIVRSSGLLDQDGTALYSVIFATGETDIMGLTASVTVPDGFTLQESVLAPDTVTVTLDGSTISWAIDGLAADTILGPLTYRVAANEDSAELPSALGVHAAWSDGEIDIPQAEGVLTPLATVGSIVVDAAGTVDESGELSAVPVGDTGLWLYVPANAVSEATTITLERLPVPTGDEGTAFFPAEAEGTWWCSVVSVSLEPDADFSLPVSLAIPTRRAVTPGLESAGFFRLADEAWQVMDASTIVVGPDGMHTLADGIMLTNGMQVAYGVNNAARLTSTVNGQTLTTNITDGTSNTVRSYIEQDNFAAALVGR